MSAFRDSIAADVEAATANAAPIQVRFSYARTISGYEVVDEATGRPVGFGDYATAQEANGKAFQLNGVAQSGDRRAFARAMRAG